MADAITREERGLFNFRCIPVRFLNRERGHDGTFELAEAYEAALVASEAEVERLREIEKRYLKIKGCTEPWPPEFVLRLSALEEEFGTEDAPIETVSFQHHEMWVRMCENAEAEVERLKAALNERELFINPHLLEQAADEIDCGASCENIWREPDVNAAGCGLSEKGDYCPNDVAETLRAVAKVARAALTGEKP